MKVANCAPAKKRRKIAHVTISADFTRLSYDAILRILRRYVPVWITSCDCDVWRIATEKFASNPSNRPSPYVLNGPGDGIAEFRDGRAYQSYEITGPRRLFGYFAADTLRTVFALFYNAIFVCTVNLYGNTLCWLPRRISIAGPFNGNVILLQYLNALELRGTSLRRLKFHGWIHESSRFESSEILRRMRALGLQMARAIWISSNYSRCLFCFEDLNLPSLRLDDDFITKLNCFQLPFTRVRRLWLDDIPKGRRYGHNPQSTDHIKLARTFPNLTTLTLANVNDATFEKSTVAELQHLSRLVIKNMAHCKLSTLLRTRATFIVLRGVSVMGVVPDEGSTRDGREVIVIVPVPVSRIAMQRRGPFPLSRVFCHIPDRPEDRPVHPGIPASCPFEHIFVFPQNRTPN